MECEYPLNYHKNQYYNYLPINPNHLKMLIQRVFHREGLSLTVIMTLAMINLILNVMELISFVF